MNYLLPVQCGAPDLTQIFYSNFLNTLNNNLKYENIQSSINDITNFNADSSKIKSKIKIGSYLAGLFEGEGYLYFPEFSKFKNFFPYIAINFKFKDYTLICKLQKLFGGNLRIKNKENTIV
jgi:hypothetical protein